MGWQETRVQDERTRFVLEVEAGERPLAALCRAYSISRKTGYKWLARFEQGGVAALADRSRAPRRHPNAVAEQVEQAVLALRARKPYWGERKLRAWLERERPEQDWPAASTIGALLKRRGLTAPPQRRRRATPSAELIAPDGPNRVWAIDFKGWFRTGDGRRCDPLTISDTASRYLLRCQAVERPDYRHVRPLLEATFREYGLPARLRSDNGPPFASTGLGGLSRLSVWLIRLGVRPERIQPGHPEQNGRHERLHRTLKSQTAAPPRATGRAQQRAFDRFRNEYNHERPHEALGMRTPASVYQASARRFPDRLPQLDYDARWLVRSVTQHGDTQLFSRRIFLSEALAGERIAFEQADGGWRVWFGPLELAWLEEKQFHAPRPRHLAPNTNQRLKPQFLRPGSGRPAGSRRRVSETQNGRASQNKPFPGTT